VSENPAKGLCNLPILNKLQSVTVGRRPQLRRDCDYSDSGDLDVSEVGRRPQLRRDCDFPSLPNLVPVLVGRRPQLRRDCDFLSSQIYGLISE